MEPLRTSIQTWGFAASSFSAVFRAAALVTFFSIVTAVAATATLAGNGRQPPPADPFALYTDLLPGQSVNFVALEAAGFTCEADPRPTPADLAELCTKVGRTVEVVTSTAAIWDGTVSRLDLRLREGAFSIGDLALVWGTPEIQQTGHWVSLRWRERHIVASGWVDSGRFTYFQPVLQLSVGL